MSFEDLADDIVLAADPAPVIDRTAIAIRDNITRMESSLSEFDAISAGLADLAARFPHDLAYAVATTKGMADAIAHRAAWREPRISVEKYRKAAKAPVLALGKDIDARASWLTEQLLLGERPVDEQIKAEEGRKEAVRQARIEAEFGRIQAIQEALADISMQAMVPGLSSGDIAARLEAMRAATLDPLVFQEMIDQAKAAQRAAIDKLELALKAKLHDEAEAARVAAERAELAELRRQAAEQKAKDEAARAVEAQAEAVRQAAVRAENERVVAALAEQQTRINAEAAEILRRTAALEVAEAAARMPAAALMQDTSRELSQALASKPDAMTHAREAASAIGPAPTMTVGQIADRLAPLKIDAAGLQALGFARQQRPGAAMHFLVGDWPGIKAAIVRHVQGLQ